MSGARLHDHVDTEAVTVAVAELAADVQEGLLAMAVGTGLQVMAGVRCATAPRPARSPSVAGGVPVQRPRMRVTDGRGELPVPAYELFSRTGVLGRMAMERMLAGLSTRRYPGRAGAGWTAGREIGSLDEQVGGLDSGPTRC